jgi:hypothetical protein
MKEMKFLIGAIRLHHKNTKKGSKSLKIGYF